MNHISGKSNKNLNNATNTNTSTLINKTTTPLNAPTQPKQGHKRTNSLNTPQNKKIDIYDSNNSSNSNYNSSDNNVKTNNNCINQSINQPSKFAPTQTYHKSKTTTTTTNLSEDPVAICLKQSLQIIDKIRTNFEKSTNDNNIPINFAKIIASSCFDITNYIQLTDLEKHEINSEIVECSEERIKNYSNLFSVINESIVDIKDFLIDIEKNKNKNLTHKPQYIRNRYSLNDNDFEKMKIPYEMGIIEENNELPSCSGSGSNDEYSCDFSETSMLENALIHPPKLTNNNYLNIQIKEMIRQKSKKSERGKKSKMAINLQKKIPTTIEEENIITESGENTIVEFGSIILNNNNNNTLDITSDMVLDNLIENESNNEKDKNIQNINNISQIKSLSDKYLEENKENCKKIILSSHNITDANTTITTHLTTLKNELVLGSSKLAEKEKNCIIF